MAVDKSKLLMLHGGKRVGDHLDAVSVAAKQKHPKMSPEERQKFTVELGVWVSKLAYHLPDYEGPALARRKAQELMISFITAGLAAGMSSEAALQVVHAVGEAFDLHAG